MKMRARVVEKGPDCHQEIKVRLVGFREVLGLHCAAALDRTLWPCRREGDVTAEVGDCVFKLVHVHSAVFRTWLLYAYLFLCLCGTEVDSLRCFLHLWKQGGTYLGSQRCSLPVNPLAAILRYIYVLGAECRLAVTCVREVVALMEFYTWQPSRQYWYVFKILSRNNTCFCCLLGQMGLFLSLMALRGPGDSTGSW